jgi:hypothetical protein
VVVARRGATLLGYAVLEMAERNWILTDLHAIEEGKTIPCILSHLDHLAETLDIDSISTPIMEGASLVRYLRRAGFHPRETAPIVACVGDLQAHAPFESTQHWLLMYGDRES